MKDYIKTLKDWHKLARPNKWCTAITFVAIILSQVCVLVSPTFEAKATVAITSGDYTGTIINLLIVFVLFFLLQMFWQIDFSTYSRTIKHIYNKINNEFVEKSLKAKSANFKYFSKEKILNIVDTDVYNVAKFADTLPIAIARLIMLIVTTVIIFTVNVWAGVIVVFANIIDFFVVTYLNSRRERYVKKIREDHDLQFEKFSEIVDTRETIGDLGIEQKIKKEYNKILDDFILHLKKRTFWDSMIENHYLTFYKFMILATTILLVILVSKNTLSVETYFLIVTYVTNGIANTNSIYNKIPDLKTVKVSQNRIKTVLDFVEKDEVSVGKNNLKDILGSLSFNHVSYKRDDDGNPTINNFDVMFKENETTLLLGPRNCGKRTVFNILRRAITPNSGCVLLDGVNLFDYSHSSHRDNFSYVITKPVFFKGSIIKNLNVVEKNRNVIYQICKELGIYNYIMNLPKKFNEDISNLPYEKLYLLGLARAILTGSEVLLIYEFPQNLTDAEKENIKLILKKMHGARTILIFSARDYCHDIADKIISMERGEIKSISFNNKNN